MRGFYSQGSTVPTGPRFLKLRQSWYDQEPTGFGPWIPVYSGTSMGLIEIIDKGSSYSIQRHPKGFYYVQTTRSEIKQLQSQISTLKNLLSQLEGRCKHALTTSATTTITTTDRDAQTVISS